MLHRMTPWYMVPLMTHIRTIDELVAFYGGDTVLAEKLGISQSAVAHWKIRRRIATGWHLRLLADLRSQGVTVDPVVFGITDQEADVLFRPLAMSDAALPA